MIVSRTFDLRSVVELISGVPLCRPNKKGGIEAVVTFMMAHAEVTNRDGAIKGVKGQLPELAEACAERPKLGYTKGWYNALEERFTQQVKLQAPQA